VDLTAHWRGRERFVVFGGAYGNGERFRALLEAWRADPQGPGRLHYIAAAGGALPGLRRMPQADPNVTLDLLNAAPAQALAQLEARLDAIVLDGLAWEGEAVARALGKLSTPGTVLAGQGLSAAQTAALAAAGFGFEASGGQAVFASRKPVAARPAPGQRRALVLGAGIAGSAACERLCARGWQVTLVERHPQAAMEASGNLAGIYMPLLSQDDNISTRLSRAAFLYALAYWDTLDGIEGARCGVMQLARDAAHAQVQRAVAARWQYPAEYAEWLEGGAASSLLGSPAPDGAWLFRQGGWARPASVCEAMLAACGDRLERRFGAGSVGIERGGGQWRALDASGATVAEAPVLVLANGTGATALAQAATLPLAQVRGQVTHLAAGALPALPFVLCREAYLTPAANGIHCAGATYDMDGETGLRQASHDDNLGKLRSLLGDDSIAQDAPLRGRVGFRCVAPDRLPLVGAVADSRPTGRNERLRELPRHPGLHALLGYASRGLTWAPLAAELLAAQLEGEPLPLEKTLVQALDPARFLLRKRPQPAKTQG
jgi:tRNA 5-methylaminomethyl-2-thiouridine biosynthesis bifunctional protein